MINKLTLELNGWKREFHNIKQFELYPEPDSPRNALYITYIGGATERFEYKGDATIEFEILE